MVLSPLEQRLVAALEQIEVIDAHEHLSPESTRLEAKVDVFTLFAHYTRGDLQVAGLSEADYEATQNSHLPLDYRWGLFAPYWEQIRWGSYARAALLAAQRFYGAEDINAQTYRAISEKMAAANTPGIYDRVLREACHIRTSLTQCGRADLGTPLLTPVLPLAPRPAQDGLASWPAMVAIGEELGVAVNTLDDFVRACQAYVLRSKAQGAVGLKTRSGPFSTPHRAEAKSVFDRLRRGEIGSLPGHGPLTDYLADELIRFAGQQDLVICVHTGYWGDFRELDPLHIIPLLQRHPRVRFDLYHLGFPWVRESLMLGKGFPNVWLNFCWTYIISERFATEALDEAIDLVPMNKVLGFGGDYGLPVEKVYGHLTMAREAMARVLARRIARGQMNEEQALRLAHRWLWDNPKELYRLPYA